MKTGKQKNRLRDFSFGAKGVWRGMAGILTFSVLISVLSVVDAACLKLLADIAAGDSQVTLLNGALISLMVMTLLALCNSFYLVAITRTQNRIARKAKEELLTHIEHVPQARLSGFHSGDLLTRLSDDTDLCARVLPDIGSALFTGAVSCLCALAYSFYLSWQMALLSMVLAPMAALWGKLVVPHIRKYAELTRKKESEIRSFSQEEIAYIPVIKSFSSYEQSRRRFLGKFDELAHMRLKTSIMNAVLNGGTDAAGFFSFIAATVLGVYLAIRGEITVGTIIGFIQVLNFIVWPFTELMPLIGELQNGKAARARLRELEELPCEEKGEDASLQAEKTELQLHQVSFSFGENAILRGVDLNLKGKRLIGVIGPSGCGKSTLMQLLLALYEPSSGSVVLTDGTNRVSGIAMRRHISYVPQDHLLITGTIAENIAYGETAFSMTDVVRAAEKAGVDEFVRGMPEGYQTMIKEKGTNLSFGQAQRIAIARAIYKDAPVLILDEPTASLDKISRERIMETLKKESEHRLCIMVCHDQSENRQMFDQILEFRDGQILLSEPGGTESIRPSGNP